METPTFLYKPNFCAECGEKIERESWHFWSSRRFCENCEPVYRLNRIFPVALAGMGLFFGGIFFGQMGQRYDRPAQILSTQAALAAEKPVAPKQALSAMQQPVLQNQNAAADQPVTDDLTPDTGKTRAPANSAPQTASNEFFTCGARTQKGTPCSRRVKAAGTRCWQHLGKPSMLEKPY